MSSGAVQGIAASLDRVASAKQQKAAAVNADVEEGGIKAHQTKAVEQDQFYKVQFQKECKFRNVTQFPVMGFLNNIFYMQRCTMMLALS